MPKSSKFLICDQHQRPKYSIFEYKILSKSAKMQPLGPHE